MRRMPRVGDFIVLLAPVYGLYQKGLKLRVTFVSPAYMTDCIVFGFNHDLQRVTLSHRDFRLWAPPTRPLVKLDTLRFKGRDGTLVTIPPLSLLSRLRPTD